MINFFLHKLIKKYTYIFFIFQFVFGQSVDISSYLPYGHSKNGDIDYTNYLQKAINENNDIIMPNFPILINEEGLNLVNNQKITFREYSKLIMKPNNKERYGIINLKNVENIEIINPKLIGDRYTHKIDTGEWGTGINILSSNNIKIINPIIKNCWGDGIYIGEIHYLEVDKFQMKNKFSQNIYIKDGLLENNRRNGISIINVKDLIIKGITIVGTNGTNPQAGICIEPNSNSQFLENIKISNVNLKNNFGYGIAYVPSRFLGSKSKNVTIKLENCLINASNIGIYLGGRTAISRDKNVTKLEGSIEIDNCEINNTKSPLKTGSNQKFNPQISFKNIFIDNDNLLFNQKLRKSLNDLGIIIN